MTPSSNQPYTSSSVSEMESTMNFLGSSKTPSTKAIISAGATATATLMIIRSITRDFLPREVRDYIYFNLKSIFSSFSSQVTLLIEEYDNLNHNNLFKASQLYLEPIIPPNTPRLKISLPNKETKVSISLEENEEITDSFKGVPFKWKFISKHSKVRYIPNPDSYHSTPVTEIRCFELSFHKKHKTMVFDSYLDHVVAKSKEMMQKKKTLKLHTLGVLERMGGRRGDVWQAVNLDHPSTFETLAMDLDLKKMIMDDLQNFVKGKDFYRRVGKAWKRGYLLFGPPGTGKSSLIAAIANYLNFDIYDLELTDVKMNSDLRKLLISTANKSILVVEDIDCTIELQNRIAEARASSKARSSSNQGYDQGNQVTLSGLLNFIDGLWSSYGDERIIIFTTNHIEKLDPALLRPGRMDLQIHMSYCSPCGFKIMASNYLGITEHPLFMEIEELIKITKVTPAEIGQQLMKSEEADAALSGLIEFLHCKNTEQENENKAKNKKEINLEEKEESINGEIEKKD